MTAPPQRFVPRKKGAARERPQDFSVPLPQVRLRGAPAGPQAFRRMVGSADANARPGDIVTVIDRAGSVCGTALFNPKSVVTLRFLTREREGFDPEKFFADRLAQAVDLRRTVLKLDAVADAYRLVYDQGDGLPGLVVDRYGEWLTLEFYSLGMFRQAERIEKRLRTHFPQAKFARRASSYTETMEGFTIPPASSARARIHENGVAFEMDLAGGYKTGFFLDQRDNRSYAASLASGRRVLDVCSYTGGFGIYAKKIGGAGEVACVELDAEAVKLLRRNANINGAEIRTVNVDAFPYLRQAAVNKEEFDLVILDPHKLIASREGFSLGARKYLDLNRLALGVLAKGGILGTASCSGLLQWQDFADIIRAAAANLGRRVQILRRSGAGADHPVAADYPEGEYLKMLWCRAL